MNNESIRRAVGRRSVSQSNESQRGRSPIALAIAAMLLAIAVPSMADDAASTTSGNRVLATVSGVVQDASGEPMPGVTVTVTRKEKEVEAGQEVAYTGMEGDFQVSGLRPGGYDLEAVLDGFEPATSRITLVTGQAVSLKLKLVPAFSESLTVVAEASKSSEVAILEARRQAPVVSDIISSEEIKKTPDSNAASVVERLTGVTLMNDKFVFIRGLGERYSGTTMNGATLPTTETEKRVVPLDLFPAKLLDTVNVVKTYTPDKPGDFGAGTVEMSTTEFPSSQTLKFSLGAGMQSGTTGNDFRRYAGGLSSFGNGGQPIPSIFPSEYLQKSSIVSPNGFTPAELETFGEALVGDWTGGNPVSAGAAQDFSLTWGNTVGPAGLVLSAVSTHKYSAQDEVQKFYALDSGDTLVPYNDYALSTDRESVNTGLVGNISLRLTDSNRVFFNSVYTRDASAENRFQEGESASTGGRIRDYRTRYQIEEVFSNRLRGEHNISGLGLGSLLEWNVSRSTATNDSDLRENLYRESSPGRYTLQVGFSSSGETDYFNLDDTIQQGGASWSTFYAMGDGSSSGVLKAGFDEFNRTRDFVARRFVFTVANQNQFDLTKSPEELFTPENIRPGGFELREVTGINDAYDAEHTVHSAYLMTDSTVGRWRFIGGARYEDSSLRVSTYNPFDTSNAVDSIDDERDILPALNVVYQQSGQTNMRFAYGRTVNRPEFRELSPYAFVEVAAGRSIAGNPDLKQATIDSLDLRWETFPHGGEVFAASIFYKNIDSPIERIVQQTSELRTSFVNAESATLSGLELEARVNASTIFPRLTNWSLSANYSWIDSKVTVGSGDIAASTNTERPLQGQSDQVGNLAIQYYRPTSGTMIRLLGSYIGERLTDVGAYGLPDIYEQPFTSLDAVVSQEIRFLHGLEMKLAANNLLDANHEFMQGGEVQRRFSPGRSVSLTLSYTPF